MLSERRPHRTYLGAVLLSVVLVMSVGTGRGVAHEGGLATLRITRFSVEGMAASGWMVRLSLADADSGKPEPTFRVTMTGRGPGGVTLDPLVLADLRNGDYEGHFQGPAGGWALEFKARPLPTADAAQPFDDARTVVLTEGNAAGASPMVSHQSSGGGERGHGVVIASVGGALAVLLLVGLFQRKRRRPSRSMA